MKDKDLFIKYVMIRAKKIAYKGKTWHFGDRLPVVSIALVVARTVDTDQEEAMKRIGPEFLPVRYMVVVCEGGGCQRLFHC